MLHTNLFVSEFGPRESEVSALPLLEELPLSSLLLLQLPLNDWLRFLHEVDGPVRVVAEETAPVGARTVELENVKEAVSAKLVHQTVLLL